MTADRSEPISSKTIRKWPSIHGKSRVNDNSGQPRRATERRDNKSWELDKLMICYCETKREHRLHGGGFKISSIIIVAVRF